MIRAAAPALAVLLVAGCSPGGDLPPIVLVTLDTTRADRIGAYGGTAVPTPVLDRLAAEGVLFEEAISQVPLTLPAHSSMMTGRYPASLGVRHNGIYRLPDTALTLAERLRDQGYETAGFVAAYVLNRGFGLEQGFDTYDDVPVDRYSGGEDQLFLAERTADEVNAAVLRWLDRRRGDRFFLWVHYYDPHDPYEPPESGRTLSGEGYDREIAYVDACLGDLLAALETQGVLDDAILAVIGDHGESLGEHGERTHGLFLYEGAVRVPFLLRAPGTLSPGVRVRHPVELVDLAPTLLELAAQPSLPEAQGVSLVPRIEGRQSGAGALAYGESLMPRLEFGWSELWMVRSGRFKFIDAPERELYDLQADPAEEHNLFAGEAERAAEMERLLAHWIAESADAGAESRAARSLDPEEEERLKSLGYLGGDFFKRGGAEGEDGGEALPDPKRMIVEVRALDAARDRLAQGEAAGALADVEAILTANPRNHQARSTKVLALIELERLAEAEEEALAALAAAQIDQQGSAVLTRKARGLLASVLHLQGKRGEAERQYRRLLESDPDHAAAAVDLARMLIDDGRHDEAADWLARVLRRDPRHGMALAARFRLERARGDEGAALSTAALLAEQGAGDGPTLADAGALLLAVKRPDEAAACFEAALEHAQTPSPEWVGRLGMARLDAGDLDGAEAAFRGLARLTPQDPRPHYFLGNVALRRGDELRARGSFQRALSFDPTFVAPLVSLGRWLAAEGRVEEAERTLRSAVTRNPNDPHAADALERLLRRSK